jgi:hypothetical protein
MKTLSFAVDDELYLQWQHTLGVIAAQTGVQAVSSSLVLREMLRRMVVAPAPPFEAGWMEGYKAGYGAVMQTAQRALHELSQNPLGANGLGVGLTPDGDPSR